MFCPECGGENNSTAKFCEQCGLTLAIKALVLTGGKPLGIVVIVIISVISGFGQMALGSIAAVIPDLMGLVTSGLAAMGGQTGVDTSVHIASLKIAGMAAGLFASGVFTLASAYGLWNFIGWGRVLAVVLYSIGLFVGLILFFTSLSATQTAGTITLQLVGFGVTIWMLIYLFRPHIRNLFHGAGIPGSSLVAGLSSPAQNSSSR